MFKKTRTIEIPNWFYWFIMFAASLQILEWILRIVLNILTKFA